MEFFKTTSSIDFMQLRKYTSCISIVLCIISLVGIFSKGLNLGLEFSGGTQIEIRFNTEVETEQVKARLAAINLNDAKVQTFGSTKDILVKLSDDKNLDKNKLAAQIAKEFQTEGAEIRRVEFVGSEVGQQLIEQGGTAIIVALIATMIYIALRFEYRFAISAASALVHDVIIVLGIFSWFSIDFDLATLAAVLAVLGYSLNDTIVVFDRVRENFRDIRNDSTKKILNLSINQTLSRTIMTSWLTLLVIIALLIYGGESLYGFSLALLIGIVVGTYSSIYIASGLALTFGLSRSDMLPKINTTIDHLP